jgi:hypothetical protein
MPGFFILFGLVLGNFPQAVANSMNWRVTISKDNLPSSLQPGERF